MTCDPTQPFLRRSLGFYHSTLHFEQLVIRLNASQARAFYTNNIRINYATLSFRIMPDVKSDIEYLQNLPLYKTEKPYYLLKSPDPNFDPDAQRLDNLEYEMHSDIVIRDIRGSCNEFTLEQNGFEVLSQQSTTLNFQSADDVEAHKRETEDLLRKQLGAVYVHCYELRERKNMRFTRKQFDLHDPLLVEGPARGAHNGEHGRAGDTKRPADFYLDVTYKSGPEIIARHLSDEDKLKYFKPGYRFRIVK